MDARFIGDPNDDLSGPKTMVWRGEEFTKGKWRKVSAEVGQKLANHSHFEVKEARRSAKKAGDDKDVE